MSKISPFDNAKILSFNNNAEVLIFADTEDIITSSTTYHTIKEGETLQSIAYQYYGDSGYWGLISRANKILNPFTEVIPGQRLLIP